MTPSQGGSGQYIERARVQSWVEMNEIRRRRLAQNAWIPLRAKKYLRNVGEKYKPNSEAEWFGLGSLAVPTKRLEEAASLGWSDIGISHVHGVYAFVETYKPVDAYQLHDEEEFGLEIVLVQHFDGDVPEIWHLNQDLVFALRLLREGNKWVRPEEGYQEVARLTTTPDGAPESLEVRGDMLREYLAARHMSLRLSWYHSRRCVVADADVVSWPGNRLAEKTEGVRYEGRIMAITADGSPYGSGVYVSRIARSDIDEYAEIPVFEEEGPDNTVHESFSFTRQGEKFHLIEGEVWKEEWVHSNNISTRIRGDEVPPVAFYLVDGFGQRESRETLHREDIGRYLWFKPSVVLALLDIRGARLEWYTRDTGSISLNRGYDVHFGVNQEYLINAYAYDVAALPDWQQQIWAAHNVSPSGGVSDELLDAQMRVAPARTSAPENMLSESIKALDDAFNTRWGAYLYKKHEHISQIAASIHRFRGSNRTEVLSLSKDIARVSIDSIDVELLHRILRPPAGQKWASIKSLENVLGSITSSGRAREVVAPLVGLYKLRLGDAHLPSSGLSEGFELLQVDDTQAPVKMAELVIMSVAVSLRQVKDIVNIVQP